MNTRERQLIPSLVILVLTRLAWVPHTLPFFTNMATGPLMTVLLAPLALAGVICAFLTGKALANVKPYSWLILLCIEIFCVVGCVLYEIMLVGYPLELCFDFCQKVGLDTAIFSYFIAVTILFVPAYCAAAIYRKKAK